MHKCFTDFPLFYLLCLHNIRLANGRAKRVMAPQMSTPPKKSSELITKKEKPQ